MTLPTFATFCLGIALEILTLWEQSRRHRNAPSRRWDILGFGVSTAQLVMLAACAGVMLLVALSELTGLATFIVSLNQTPTGMLFVLLGLFLIYFGVVDPRLLPRINTQAALSVHTTVALGLMLTVTDASWRTIFALTFAAPTLGLLYIGLTRRILTPIPQALVYLWYLICLFILALQSDFSTVTQPISAPFSYFEAFMVGAAGVFLILHSLFLARFFAIVSSLILPKNRQYIVHAMPRLFDDARMPRWQLLILLGTAAVVLLLNARFDVMPNITVINAVVLAVVQVLPSVWRRIQSRRQ